MGASLLALAKSIYYPLPTGLFRDNLQHWLGDFARLLRVQFTSTGGMSDDAPIHECESEIVHYTGHYTTIWLYIFVPGDE